MDEKKTLYDIVLEFWNLLNELYIVFDELSPEKQEKLAQLILRLQEVL